MQQPAEAHAGVEANSIWFVIVIIAGLLSSLAWMGFLAWAAGKVLDLW
jgi:hypothetical protein